MAFVVELCGGDPWGEDFRFFCCASGSWRQLLDLAREHGWAPAGAAHDPRLDPEVRVRFPNDYEPQEWPKWVSAEDASALADALARLVQKLRRGEDRLPPHTGGYLVNDGAEVPGMALANAALSVEFLENAIVFLEKGEFSFAWDA